MPRTFTSQLMIITTTIAKPVISTIGTAAAARRIGRNNIGPVADAITSVVKGASRS